MRCPQAAYGQGQVVASPFQMARVAATIANNGTMPYGRWITDESNPRVEPRIPSCNPTWPEHWPSTCETLSPGGTGRTLAGNPRPDRRQDRDRRTRQRRIARMVHRLRSIRLDRAVASRSPSWSKMASTAARPRPPLREISSQPPRTEILQDPPEHTMSLFRDIEKRIDAQLKKLFTSENAAAQGKELIEIQRAILDEVEDHAQMLPRARRRFPYNDLIVRIAAPEPDRRSAIDLVFIEGNALQTEIANHLRSEHIEVPAGPPSPRRALEDPPAEIAAKGFHIIYNTQGSRQTSKPNRNRPCASLSCTASTEQPSYEINKPRIHLGRLSEVLDERRRPVRRNDVVFPRIIRQAELDRLPSARPHRVRCRRIGSSASSMTAVPTAQASCTTAVS